MWTQISYSTIDNSLESHMPRTTPIYLAEGQGRMLNFLFPGLAVYSSSKLIRRTFQSSTVCLIDTNFSMSKPASCCFYQCCSNVSNTL